MLRKSPWLSDRLPIVSHGSLLCRDYSIVCCFITHPHPPTHTLTANKVKYVSVPGNYLNANFAKHPPVSRCQGALQHVLGDVTALGSWESNKSHCQVMALPFLMTQWEAGVCNIKYPCSWDHAVIRQPRSDDKCILEAATSPFPGDSKHLRWG